VLDSWWPAVNHSQRENAAKKTIRNFCHSIGGILLAIRVDWLLPLPDDEETAEDWGEGEFEPLEEPPGTWTVDFAIDPPPDTIMLLRIEWQYQD
jgi:hypothetical protein